MLTKHDAHAATARQKWGRVTPYRLGVVAGLAGDTIEFLPNPYQHGRSRTLYAHGVDVGMKERAAAKEPTHG